VTGIPVCIFAKPPIPGEVKTRLAESVGPESAASLAAAMLRDVWSTVSAAPEVISVLAAASAGSFPIDVPDGAYWLQETGELGFRIERILRRGLTEAPAAVALGADSPSLTVSHLQSALRELETVDAVIGPSRDGGFYLLGLRRCPSGLLQNLPWSTAETFERTLDRLRSHSMSVSLIDTLPDVDTLEDLQTLYNELQEKPLQIAPATRHWFAGHLWLASSSRP
jgi:uncharacterized protein